MSARAAVRLESLGFRQVYRYTAGKMDWLANGLPCEGKQAGEIYRAADLARKDVPTCRLGEQVGLVYDRVQAAGWQACAVLDGEQVVVGLIQEKAFRADRSTPVEQVMDCAPRTFRMNAPLEKIAEYIQKYSVKNAFVTTSDGRLIGLINRDDI